MKTTSKVTLAEPILGSEMRGEGEERGIRWAIQQVAERRFRIEVRRGDSQRTSEYATLHPTHFGLDLEDQAEIEAVLDNLIQEIQHAGEE